MRPRLKGVVWERTGDDLRVVYDWRDQFIVEDPDGTVERLLGLLRVGGRTVDELAAELGVPGDDISVALAALDGQRLLEDGDRLDRLGAQYSERHRSTLAFFESFASLATSREDLVTLLRDAHVMVLGTGGLNSTVLQHLCGLGVGRLTVLDRDRVEAANFARQYLYRWRDIGRSKVARAAEWVREFDPAIEVVDAVVADIDSAATVGDLLDRYRPDVVASGADRPVEIDGWVNAACVPRGVPFVRGGVWVTQGVVWSVDPGVSACYACPEGNVEAAVAADPDGDGSVMLAGIRLFASISTANRGIGPVTGLLGSLCAFEVLRFVTRFEPPIYAGHPLVVDFAGGCASTHVPTWERRPDCPVCAPPAPRPADGLSLITRREVTL